jgi:hypothetical protein
LPFLSVVALVAVTVTGKVNAVVLVDWGWLKAISV